ncbi:MAG: DinB family protein, partial [Acidobacteria bacterium]|nr:DinB family protein [Acidobacteriota bacterium]
MSTAANLIDQLKEARSRTLALVEDLTDEQLMGPRLEIVNPLLWEIGHVAWFQEKWTLRHLLKKEPIREDGDRLYDSMAVAHDTRWDLPLPSRQETFRYMEQVLAGISEALQAPKTEEESYFYRLALFHEDMHDEAFTYTRQTLSYSPPPLWAQDREGTAAPQGE